MLGDYLTYDDDMRARDVQMAERHNTSAEHALDCAERYGLSLAETLAHYAYMTCAIQTLGPDKIPHTFRQQVGLSW